MQIRPLTADDVPAADRAAWSALREHIPDAFAHENSERARRGRYRIAHLLETDPDGAWVAELDGEIVGIGLALLREGVWGLRQSGLNKVRLGITSLDEINSVTVD